MNPFSKNIKDYTQVNHELLNYDLNRKINELVKKWESTKLQSTNVSEVVGQLVGYDVVQNDLKCGGYCDIHTGKIGLNKSLIEYETVFHEVAHAIQADFGYFSYTENLISRELYLEQQAETISYDLYRKCFHVDNLSTSGFMAYFTRRDKLFLIDWYGEWKENDIQLYRDPNGNS